MLKPLFALATIAILALVALSAPRTFAPATSAQAGGTVCRTGWKDQCERLGSRDGTEFEEVDDVEALPSALVPAPPTDRIAANPSISAATQSVSRLRIEAKHGAMETQLTFGAARRRPPGSNCQSG
jgi:hypothetical protein